MAVFISISQVIASVGTLLSINIENAEWWQTLLIFIILEVVNVGGTILIKWLMKKGLITKKDAQKIEDKLEDLTDDGKLNNSNGEDKKEWLQLIQYQ